MDKILWDERDVELNLRHKLAVIVAQIISGVETPDPTDEDFVLADAFRAEVTQYLDS